MPVAEIGKCKIKITVNKEKNRLKSNDENLEYAKDVISPIECIIGIQSERKEILKKISNSDLRYLREGRKVIKTLKKEEEKLYDIAKRKKYRLTSGISILVGAPISRKEMKAKFGNANENKIINYVLANDNYIEAKNRTYNMQRTLANHIQNVLLGDFNFKANTLEEDIPIFLVKSILTRRYILMHSNENIASFLGMKYRTFFDNYKNIL